MRARWRDLREDAFYYFDALALRVWDWDHKCLELIGGYRRLRRWEKLFVGATYFGDGYLWLLVGLALVGFGDALDRRRVLVAVVVTLCNIAFFRLSKWSLKRDRPAPLPSSRDLRYRYLDSYSFPSGHATTSFGLAYMIAHFYPFLPIQIAAYTASAVIAFSRVYVGEHYPSDVISGGLLGILMTKLLLPIVSAFFL